MGALLLVAWLNAGGDPKAAYSVQFSTMAACVIARDEMYREQARLARINPNGPGLGPVVSAICVNR